MSLILKVNTIDVSSSIDWQTLTKTEGLTKEPDALSFTVKKTPSKTIPAMGASIELYEDAVKIFKGTITERHDKVIGGILLGYDYICKDLTHDLDRKLVVKAYESMTAGDIIKNIIDTFTTGFTYANIPAVTPTLGTVKFNYEQPSKAIQKICDLINYDWYVDYNGDIHLFDSSTSVAPYTIDDTSGNLEWRTLKFDRNIIELKNSVIIRGGEYTAPIIEAEVVDKYIADGTQRVFTQIYRYSNYTVKKNGTTLTVGIDNIDDEASFDCLYNYSEKALKFPDASKPIATDVIKIWGDAHIPLITKVRDQISIAAYGTYEHIEVKKDINSKAEAKSYCKTLLKKWAEGASEGSFKSVKTGWATGQQVTINSTILGNSGTYKINRITGKALTSGQMEYTVNFIASGETTFTDIMVGLLSKDRENITLSDDEVLQRLEVFPEVVEFVEAVTASKKSAPYLWGVSGGNDLIWNFGTWK